jgi:hypothetical protein
VHVGTNDDAKLCRSSCMLSDPYMCLTVRRHAYQATRLLAHAKSCFPMLEYIASSTYIVAHRQNRAFVCLACVSAEPNHMRVRQHGLRPGRPPRPSPAGRCQVPSAEATCAAMCAARPIIQCPWRIWRPPSLPPAQRSVRDHACMMHDTWSEPAAMQINLSVVPLPLQVSIGFVRSPHI